MREKTTYPKDKAIEIVPQVKWRVISVSPLPSYKLYVKFVDHLEGYVDMAAFVHNEEAGVFSALRDEAVFNQVYLSYGAVTWPGEIDLAPDAMYDAIKKHGEWVLR